MDPNTRGWLQDFCNKVQVDGLTIADQAIPDYEQMLYKMVQPSGIMYGHPVKEIGGSGVLQDQLDPVGKMKLIYAESLLRAGWMRLAEVDQLNNDQNITQYLIPEISEYFLNLYPDLYRGSSSSYVKKPYYLAETLIAKRVSVNTSLVKNYLANLFHNSMLFIDVLLFGEWIKGMGSQSVIDLRSESSRFRLTVLGVMALAASADKKLQNEERALFEFYLESSGIDAAMKKEARTLLNGFGSLSEIDIPEIDSWLIRKYLLEMGILVTLADREINESEQEFIYELGSILGFTKTEISESMLSVESFVLDNWSSMHYLLGKSNLDVIRKRFMVRLKGFIDKNKNYVVQEIKESKELFYLLGKSRTSSLTIEEKKIVNEQLIDILKTIPAFIIIALPFTFITLPTLLALLPPKAFPSSFQE